MIRIVSFVGDDRFGFDSLEQRMRVVDVMDLARAEQQSQRPPQGVNQQVDLGRQSSSTSPHSLIGAPPFPVTACWWALTREESIIT